MSSKPQVLIVEDDPKMAGLLSLILKQAGYNPVPAHGALEGMHLLEENGIDLILLDVMMDDLDGWTLLRSIKENDKLRDIPVLVVSARHPLEDPDVTAAHASLIEGYLVKPFLTHELLIEIRKLLN
jgi:DNA-binding response OmpR family regulator